MAHGVDTATKQIRESAAHIAQTLAQARKERDSMKKELETEQHLRNAAETELKVLKTTATAKDVQAAKTAALESQRTKLAREELARVQSQLAASKLLTDQAEAAVNDLRRQVVAAEAKSSWAEARISKADAATAAAQAKATEAESNVAKLKAKVAELQHLEDASRAKASTPPVGAQSMAAASVTVAPAPADGDVDSESLEAELDQASAPERPDASSTVIAGPPTPAADRSTTGVKDDVTEAPPADSQNSDEVLTAEDLA
mmetsp:Transcript_27071/g.65332  ORF Transcript_27071/g.65332 Transcript_27071/m.65332 type:complete len:259 (+) Transcript_27071:72-848(+)